MKLAFTALIFACLLGLHAKPAEAHQPRLVTGEATVTIKKPEVSQAFYGQLRGEPAQYQIIESEPFELYFGILVPDLPDSRKNFTVDVYSIDNGESVHLTQLDGNQQHWEPFYEPFVADNYYQGPEEKRTVAAGTYKIVVSNPDNTGKYVLSVGEEESFSPSEMLMTIRRLPDVKRFFYKSPWTAYFNLIGLFMLLFLLLLSAIGFGIYKVGKII